MGKNTLLKIDAFFFSGYIILLIYLCIALHYVWLNLNIVTLFSAVSILWNDLVIWIDLGFELSFDFSSRLPSTHVEPRLGLLFVGSSLWRL